MGCGGGSRAAALPCPYLVVAVGVLDGVRALEGVGDQDELHVRHARPVPNYFWVVGVDGATGSLVKITRNNER